MTAFNLKSIVLVVTTTAFSIGCGSMSSRNKIYRDMAFGALAGTALAQTKTDNQSAYTSMYAGIGAATAGVASVYFNTQIEEELQTENEKLKAKLNQFEALMNPKLIQQGNSLFSQALPKEMSGLVEPGEWKRYKMDQWVQDPNQPNTWYRQIEMFEITPPTSK